MAVFIFDIDGTLCEDSTVITKEDLIVLNKLKNTGHKVMFATGRGHEAVKDALHNNDYLLNTLIACENGSKVFSNNKLLSISQFSKQELKLIIKLINSNKKQIECIDFWINSKLYTYQITSFVTPIIEDKYRIKIEFKETLNFIKNLDVTMLNISFSSMPASLTTNNLNILISNNIIQILPINTSKAKLYDSIDMHSEVHIFGDGNNDIELFRIGSKLKKRIYLVGDNKNLKPYAVSNINGIRELFSYLQSNF